MTTYRTFREFTERVAFQLDAPADGGGFHADDVWHVLHLAAETAKGQYGHPLAEAPRGAVRVITDDTSLTVYVELFPHRPQATTVAVAAPVAALVDWADVGQRFPELAAASLQDRTALVCAVMDAQPRITAAPPRERTDP